MEFPTDMMVTLLGFGMWCGLSLLVPCWVWRRVKSAFFSSASGESEE